jgi:exonuclease III
MSTNQLTYWTWNANGLPAKIDWLTDAMMQQEYLPDAVMITETHGTKTRKMPEIPGYTAWYSHNIAAHGGTAIFHRTILPADRLDDGSNHRITAGKIRDTI